MGQAAVVAGGGAGEREHFVYILAQRPYTVCVVFLYGVLAFMSMSISNFKTVHFNPTSRNQSRFAI